MLFYIYLFSFVAIENHQFLFLTFNFIFWQKFAKLDLEFWVQDVMPLTIKA